MTKTITGKYGILGTVDTDSYLSDMQRTCSLFFKTPHGKHETFQVYKGQLIVRNTVKLDNTTTAHRTTVYLYLKEEDNHYGLFCVSSNKQVGSIKQAKQLIDTILTSGQY